jgi:putative redox protein
MAEASRVTAVLADNGIQCKDANGAQVTAGGPGPRASDLLLMAVAGCSGGTLKAMMAKEGWNLSRLDISVEGVRSEDRPRRYTDIEVHYDMECKGLPQDKAEAFVKATGDNCFVMQSISSKKHLSFTLKG